mgnify:CR=1 FL=1
MPEVSIITPLYNGSKTLHETYESVMGQDYNDWEWILYEDGSSDDTKALALKYSKDHPDKIFFYEHEGNRNHGTAYTRNRAVEKSKGEFIAFIDQDDIWYNDRLTHQIRILREHKDCSMIWSPALYWYEDRTFEQPVLMNNEKIKTGVYKPGEMVEMFLNDLRSTPLPSATIIRRSIFDKVNGFEESVKGSEDVVLWIKTGDKFNIYFDDRIIVKYRKHFDSTLRREHRSGKMNEWNLVFYKWVIDFVKGSSYNKSIVKDYEFTYYTCLKKIAGKEGYAGSRRILKNELDKFPELKQKYSKDFILDLILPFRIASKLSAKIRFVWFKDSVE